MSEIKVDLGCGEDKPDGYLGIDIRETEATDIVSNLEHGIPLPDNSVDKIRAHHFLEHISDPIYIMEEIWRVLRDGGILVFEVPSTEGKGAFVPGHLSYWNDLSFKFFIEDKLRKTIGTRAKFKEHELTTWEDRKWGTVYVQGALAAVKDESGKQLGELGDFDPPKPAVARYIEFFSPEKVWDEWAEEKIKEGGLFVEPKLNGFRSIITKDSSDLKLLFEDSLDTNQIDKFSMLKDKLEEVEENFVLDLNLGINEEGHPIPRIDMMTLTADKPEIEEGQKVVATIFDLPYWEEELAGLPFVERRDKMEQFYHKYLEGSENFAITDVTQVDSQEELQDIWKKYAGRENIEGVVIKTGESNWQEGGMQDWSKIKKAVELKVLVVGKSSVEGADAYTYSVGLDKEDSTFENLIEYQGEDYIDLGGTFNTSIQASQGDVLTVQIEELIVNEEEKELAWVAPTVMGKASRDTPYNADQAVDLAERGEILYYQDERGSR